MWRLRTKKTEDHFFSPGEGNVLLVFLQRDITDTIHKTPNVSWYIQKNNRVKIVKDKTQPVLQSLWVMGWQQRHNMSPVVPILELSRKGSGGNRVTNTSTRTQDTLDIPFTLSHPTKWTDDLNQVTKYLVLFRQILPRPTVVVGPSILSSCSLYILFTFYWKVSLRKTFLGLRSTLWFLSIYLWYWSSNLKGRTMNLQQYSWTRF